MDHIVRLIGMVVMACILGMWTSVYASQTIVAVKVDTPPVVDGKTGDKVWSKALEVITHDMVADIDIRIRAVYTLDTVFFQVRFPDANESRLHKPWIWDSTQEMYVVGPDREDCVVLKWAMQPATEDLSLKSDVPYLADIWFWKANRTDPAGYADDKHQILSKKKEAKSKEITSANGNTLFLRRYGDAGKPAYKVSILIEHQGDKVSQFIPQQPTGSRADIVAKGQWREDEWCVEFSRKLDTGHDDDIVFDPERRYLFGISRYEIAGRKPDPSLTQPFYGSGDVNELLFLVFKP